MKFGKLKEDKVERMCKARRKISLFGMGPDFDWFIIITIFIVLLVAISIHAFSIFSEIDNRISESENIIPAMTKEEVDQDKISEIKTMFDNRLETFRSLGGDENFQAEDVIFFSTSTDPSIDDSPSGGE